MSVTVTRCGCLFCVYAVGKEGKKSVRGKDMHGFKSPCFQLHPPLSLLLFSLKVNLEYARIFTLALFFFFNRLLG